MTDLKIFMAEELLTALDEIQTSVPYILDYYVENTKLPECIDEMDMDLLSMNILSLRDTTKQMHAQLELEMPDDNTDISNEDNMINNNYIALTLHLYMLLDPESIYYSDVIGNPSVFNNDIKYGK